MMNQPTTSPPQSNADIRLLKLSEIPTTAGTQIRASINKEALDEYAEAMKDATNKFPPVVVFHDGNRYILADGFHRVLAATRNGFRDIVAEVRKGAKSDALKYALSANAAHGIQRTNLDKRRSAEMALHEWPNLSDVELGRICAVSHTFVADVRRSIQPATVAGSPRIGADGKARRLPVPSYPNAPATQPRDKTGFPIPKNILEGWNLAVAEFETFREIQKWKSKFQKFQEAIDRPVIYGEVNCNSVFADLSNAWNSIKQITPYAVCLKCQGLMPKDCPRCKGRGYVSELFWKNENPEEKEFRVKVMRGDLN